MKNITDHFSFLSPHSDTKIAMWMFQVVCALLMPLAADGSPPQKTLPASWAPAGGRKARRAVLAVRVEQSPSPVRSFIG